MQRKKNGGTFWAFFFGGGGQPYDSNGTKHTWIQHYSASTLAVICTNYFGSLAET